MGMFDTIIYQDSEYQTKDLDCDLTTYTIKYYGLYIGDEYQDFTGEIEFYG